MNWEENLKTRKKKTIGDCFSDKGTQFILQSPFDFGVMRNGGRRGSRHAPQSLLANFLKMAAHQELSLKKFSALALEKDFDPMDDSVKAFDNFQKKESDFFQSVLSGKYKSALHLGGGHDHVFPFASAILETWKSLVILNIDAHLDSRADKLHHSGTPFRQLHEKYGKKLSLYQIGIHPFANVKENYEGMGEMKLLETNEEDLREVLMDHQKNGDHLLLSLDCDGLDASYMPAVSAPNHQGLTQDQYQKIFDVCLHFWEATKTPKLYGVYEYNPLFDDLAGSAARYLASTFYTFFKGNP